MMTVGNEYPSTEISGMRFHRPPVVNSSAVRQLDSNDILEAADPDSALGTIIYNIVYEIYNSIYVGPQGDSAYEVAVIEGFVGTVEEWLESLQGLSSYEIAVELGYVGTEAEWLESQRGKSAYETAVELGYVGTEAQWIASLHARDILPMQCNGTLTVKTWPTATYVNRAGTYRVRASVRVRGTGDSLIVNIHVNGVVSSLAGSNRPTIAAGSGTGTDASDTLVTLAQGDIITAVEVVQVGADWNTLTVQLFEEV
jgi:hypothetical protein